MKTLLLDIETSPNTVHVWGLYQQNVGINQIIDSGRLLCFAAKWYGEDEIIFDSKQLSSHKRMVKHLYRLLNEAEVVVHFNGKKFDIPTVNKEFLLFGLTPPSPYKQVDLYTTVKRQFRFPSNKLDYVSQALGLGAKVHHRGHDLWIGCMNGDPEAWEEMSEYNQNDVVLLERLYDRLIPWVPSHPNHGLYGEAVRVCPSCGESHYQKRGFERTRAGVYQRYQCKHCGSWFRDAASQKNNHGPAASERFTQI